MLFFASVFCCAFVMELAGQWDQSNFLQKTKTTIPQTMSVVLPCLNEPYAAKTVMSFCNRTPSEARNKQMLGSSSLPKRFGFAGVEQDKWRWVKIEIVPPVNIPIPTKIGS